VGNNRRTPFVMGISRTCLLPEALDNLKLSLLAQGDTGAAEGVVVTLHPHRF
jgi:hypothetical protein